MKNRFVLLLLALIFSSVIKAQPWMENIKHENPDFYEIKEAFNEHAKTRTPNFKGMKQYKRWEWFFEARVDEDGRVPAQTYWESANEVSKAKRVDKGNANWEALGPFEIPLNIQNDNRSGVGRVNCIEFHPSDPNTFWIGTPVGGVWKTTDNGTTWTTTTDDLLSIGISDIVVNPLNPDVVYIATGDRDASDIFSVGILKSFDGGENWSTTGLSFNIPELTNVNEILMNPNDTSMLVAATSVGIYKTINCGDSWSLVSPALNFKEMITKSDDFNIILAATYNRQYGNTKVYRSENGGDSWSLNNQFTSYLSDVERTAFANTPADPNIIYAVCAKAYYSNTQGFYRSTDAGVTWELLSDENTPDIIGYPYPSMQGYGQSFYDLTLIVSPTNPNIVVVGSVAMYRSEDGGNDWNLIQGYYQTADWIHVDFHEFRQNPLNDRLYVGCDGGIYYSDNFGDDWTDISAGLQILQSYRIDACANVEGYVVMGNQDNGSMRAMDGVFNDINGSDGTECIIDYESPNTVYTSAIFGDFYRSENYGHTWYSASPPGQSGNWLAPLVMDPNDHETIYAGYGALWKSENKGSYDSWEQISDNFSGNIHRIAVAKTNSDVIYVSTFNNIWKTADGGESWANIKNNLASGFYSDVQVSPVDENKLWISLGGFNANNKMFVSENGGITWENITQNLPNLPVNCIVYDRNTSDGIYIGNDAGVYYKNNSMDDWELFSNNLPNVIVTDLVIQYDLNKIVAGTYGRGIWTSNTFYTDELPVAAFEADYSFTCSGKMKFVNKTTAYFDSVFWHFGDGAISQDLNPEHTYSAAGDYQVVQTIYKDGNEYTSSENISIDQIYEQPIVTNGSHCGSGEVVLSAAGSENIYWFENSYANEVIAEGAEFTTPTLQETTTYYVANGTDEDCFSDLVEAIASIYMEAVPAFAFEIQENTTVAFTNESENSTEYLWDFGDGEQSTDEHPVHQYASAGDYEVKLHASNENCIDSIMHPINLLNLTDLQEFSSFKIFPNPTSGDLNIRLTVKEKTAFTLNIIDAKGNVMLTKNFSDIIGSWSERFNVHGFSKGLYLIKIQTEKNIYTYQIVIE